jgi:hypothetical protein
MSDEKKEGNDIADAHIKEVCASMLVDQVKLDRNILFCELITDRLARFLARCGALVPTYRAWVTKSDRALAFSGNNTPFFSGLETIFDYFEIRRSYAGAPIPMPCEITRSVYFALLETQPEVLDYLCELHGCELQKTGLDLNTSAPEAITRAWVGACALDGITPKVGLLSVFTRKIPNLWAIGEFDGKGTLGLKIADKFKLEKMLDDTICVKRASDGWVIAETNSKFFNDPRFELKEALGTGLCLPNGGKRITITDRVRISGDPNHFGGRLSCQFNGVEPWYGYDGKQSPEMEQPIKMRA